MQIFMVAVIISIKKIEKNIKKFLKKSDFDIDLFFYKIYIN